MSADMDFSVEAGVGWGEGTRIEPDRACRLLLRLIRLAAVRVSGELQVPPPEVAVHAYTAPERLRMAPRDELTEVYAFGALLYNMLTGRLPFDAADPVALTRCILTSDPELITTHVPELPSALAAVVARALCRERSGRIESLEVLARALEPFAGTRYEAPVDHASSRPRSTRAAFRSSDDTRVLTRVSQAPRLSPAPRLTEAVQRLALPTAPAHTTRALRATRPLAGPFALRATEPARRRDPRLTRCVSNWLIGAAMVVMAALFGVGVYHALPPAVAPSGQQTPWVAHSRVRVRAVAAQQPSAAHAVRTSDSVWTTSRR